MRTAWTAYPAPAASTPIVVISDLGIGRPGSAVDQATSAEWLAFADLARRAGAPIVAFVPYPSERVPAALRRAMVVVPWDRSTSIRDVHRRVGPGLAVAAR
jgi:hypothetical protein